MRRWKVALLLTLGLTGCGPAGDPLGSAAMQQAGDWRLLDSSAAGEKWTARYGGSPEVRVELTRKSSQTAAFSAVQSWRAEAGKLAFYRGRYFGVAKSPGADMRTLSRFVSAFEKLLPQ